MDLTSIMTLFPNQPAQPAFPPLIPFTSMEQFGAVHPVVPVNQLLTMVPSQHSTLLNYWDHILQNQGPNMLERVVRHQHRMLMEHCSGANMMVTSTTNEERLAEAIDHYETSAFLQDPKTKIPGNGKQYLFSPHRSERLPQVVHRHDPYGSTLFKNSLRTRCVDAASEWKKLHHTDQADWHWLAEQIKRERAYQEQKGYIEIPRKK